MILPKVTLKADDCTQVRLLDIVKDAILYAHKWAVDRSITATYVKDVTAGLQEFIRDLNSQVASVNVEVYADEALNTASALGAGKSYWNIHFSNVLPTEQSIYRMEVTTQWVPQVLSPKEAAL
ncbi:phage tail sheath C-terminal domain-containing protein [Pseudomonas sp. GL-B-19]|uniref:phage tail sheath C-terminal domain-containing protein n=1 Tax=Pseudomonas sp. GL-B-19 TaxID=2832393 RepID=UPI0039894D97